MINKVKNWRGLAIAALFTVGLVTTIASGGGGSGGGGGNQPPSAGPTLPVTAANGLEISSALVVTIGMTFDIGDITGGGIPIQAADMLIDIASTKSDEAGRISLAATEAPGINQCANSGTVDITYTLANPNSVTVGDRIIAVFDNCDDNEGYVIDGTVDLTVSAVEGDILTDVFLLGFDVVMAGVSIDDGTDVVTSDGFFTMTFDNLEFPVLGLNLAGDELVFGTGGETLTLTNFDHDLRIGFGVYPGTLTAQASGTLDSTSLGGSVDYATPVEIAAMGDLDPYGGEILITGANDSTVRIVIVDSSHVTLEVDSNGDGTVDDYIDTNWSELNGHTSTINVSTAPVIAREVYNAVTGFGSVTTTAGAQFTTAGPFDQVDQLDVTGDFGPLDIACAISGNALVSGSKVVADGYSAGDTLAANFAACARGGEVLNGDLDFTLASFGRGAGSTFFVSGSVTETELIRTMGGSCFTGSGSFETSYDSMFTSAGIIYVEGFADTFDVAAGGRSQHLTGAGNSAEIQVAQQPVTVVRSSWGTISSDDIAGSYNYESLTPAYFHLDDDPATGPFAGELLVTAADGSSLRMVALDELTLRLDIDLDGDSTIDEMLLTSWATLAYDDWVCP
ncbi:MAG: hypothetical protein P8Y01_07085 [Woeseiaceae bacterium]